MVITRIRMGEIYFVFANIDSVNYRNSRGRFLRVTINNYLVFPIAVEWSALMSWELFLKNENYSLTS